MHAAAHRIMAMFIRRGLPAHHETASSRWSRARVSTRALLCLAVASTRVADKARSSSACAQACARALEPMCFQLFVACQACSLPRSGKFPTNQANSMQTNDIVSPSVRPDALCPQTRARRAWTCVLLGAIKCVRYRCAHLNANRADEQPALGSGRARDSHTRVDALFVCRRALALRGHRRASISARAAATPRGATT